MKYLLKKKHITGQESVIRNYGEAIWCDICEVFALGARVELEAAIDHIPSIAHLARETQRKYIKCVLHNVILEKSEDPALIQTHGRFYLTNEQGEWGGLL